MRTNTTFKKTCAITITTVFLAAGIQATIMAAMVDNNQLAMQAELQLKRDEVRSFMAACVSALQH